VQAVYNRREKLTLSPEERFFLENTYRDFVRGGALLDEKGKARLRDLNRNWRCSRSGSATMCWLKRMTSNL